jgi:hypothetical protein
MGDAPAFSAGFESARGTSHSIGSVTGTGTCTRDPSGNHTAFVAAVGTSVSPLALVTGLLTDSAVADDCSTTRSGFTVPGLVKKANIPDMISNSVDPSGHAGGMRPVLDA